MEQIKLPQMAMIFALWWLHYYFHLDQTQLCGWAVFFYDYE